MDLSEHIKQYQNDDLCQKWNNNIPASELDFQYKGWGHGHTYTVDSQAIRELCEQFSFLPCDDITGIISDQYDGDYTEVYVTESSRPYSLQAIFHPLSYYLEG